MKRGKIYIKDVFCGILTESEGARALSPTMPLTEAPYQKEVTAEKLINKMVGHKDKWLDMIDCSFLPDDLKIRYKELINIRLETLAERRTKRIV